MKNLITSVKIQKKLLLCSQELYEDEWIDLKKEILQNQDLLKTLNEFLEENRGKWGLHHVGIKTIKYKTK